jgi:hypothetical protein
MRGILLFDLESSQEAIELVEKDPWLLLKGWISNVIRFGWLREPFLDNLGDCF